MQDIIIRLRHSQPFRYIFIGGVSYVVEMAVLLFLAYILHLSPGVSVALSFWVGLMVAFTLQKYIAFNNKTSSRKVIGKQATLYGGLVLLNYIFTLVFVSLFVGLLGLAISRTVALIITTFWNYFVYRKLFK